MPHLVEFETSDGETVLVEAAGAMPPGQQLVSRGGAVVEKAELTFEEAVDRLRPVAATVISKLGAMAHGPNQITLEMSVSLSAKAGAILVSGDAEASLKIAMVWQRSSDGSDGSDERQ